MFRAIGFSEYFVYTRSLVLGPCEPHQDPKAGGMRSRGSLQEKEVLSSGAMTRLVKAGRRLTHTAGEARQGKCRKESGLATEYEYRWRRGCPAVRLGATILHRESWAAP